MKKIAIITLTLAFFLATGNIFAQKLKSGDLKVIKGQTTINVQFDYSTMTVGKKNNEKDYVTEKAAELNKKEPGKGDKWSQAWIDDRTKLFQPTFLTELNSKISNYQVQAKESATDAKYTLIVRTTYTEPGYNIGISKKEAMISLMIDLVQTADPLKILASVEVKNVYKKWQTTYDGVSFDFAVGQRLQACYEQAGISFGKFLAKNALK